MSQLDLKLDVEYEKGVITLWRGDEYVTLTFQELREIYDEAYQKELMRRVIRDIRTDASKLKALQSVIEKGA